MIKKYELAVVYHPDGTVTTKIDDKIDLELLQSFVGGFIQDVKKHTKKRRFKQYKQLYCNEEGIKLGLPKNSFDKKFVGNLVGVSYIYLDISPKPEPNWVINQEPPYTMKLPYKYPKCHICGQDTDENIETMCCGKPVCDEHSSLCHKCDYIYCDNCNRCYDCSVCNQQTCKDCDSHINIDQIICSDCLKTDYKKIIYI
jgi:hypothetical protein